MKALITGASSGIGRDMARVLSNMGHDLILVARREDRLIELKSQLKTDAQIIVADVSSVEACIDIYNKVKDENIDILINNAGFGIFGKFTDIELDKELNMIDVNIKAVDILTKLFLKDFIKRDYGRILNVASMAGFMPGPYMATYYATKSYVVNLSLAIYEELKMDKSNVKISVFCPGPVKTNFDNVANVKFNIMQLESEYASKYAIDNMFLDKLIIIPPNMKLNKFLSKIGPTKLVLYINSKVQRRKFKK